MGDITAVILIYIQRIDVLLICWVIPLFIAEAVHFLIETPEHYGLDTQTDKEVLKNTWTIKTNYFFEWLTNKNNFHTAHHFHTGVPMQNISKLQEKIERFCRSKSSGYFAFYRDVITGKIKYQEGKSAMKN